MRVTSRSLAIGIDYSRTISIFPIVIPISEVYWFIGPLARGDLMIKLESHIA